MLQKINFSIKHIGTIFLFGILLCANVYAGKTIDIPMPEDLTSLQGSFKGINRYVVGSKEVTLIVFPLTLPGSYAVTLFHGRNYSDAQFFYGEMIDKLTMELAFVDLNYDKTEIELKGPSAGYLKLLVENSEIKKIHFTPQMKNYYLKGQLEFFSVDKNLTPSKVVVDGHYGKQPEEVFVNTLGYGNHNLNGQVSRVELFNDYALSFWHDGFGILNAHVSEGLLSNRVKSRVISGFAFFGTYKKKKAIVLTKSSDPNNFIHKVEILQQ